MVAHKAHNLGITGSIPTIPASYSLFMIYVSSIRIWYMNFFFFPLLQNRPLFQTICPGSLWARNNRWLLSRVQRLAGLGGRGLLSRLEPPTGIKGPPFVPVGVSNRDKRSWPPYPLPSPPPEPFSSLVSCCSWLGREFLLISSPHL